MFRHSLLAAGVGLAALATVGAASAADAPIALTVSGIAPAANGCSVAVDVGNGLAHRLNVIRASLSVAGSGLLWPRTETLMITSIPPHGTGTATALVAGMPCADVTAVAMGPVTGCMFDNRPVEGTDCAKLFRFEDARSAGQR